MSRQVLPQRTSLSARFATLPDPPARLPAKTNFVVKQGAANRTSRRVNASVTKQRRQNIIMDRRGQRPVTRGRRNDAGPIASRTRSAGGRGTQQKVIAPPSGRDRSRARRPSVKNPVIAGRIRQNGGGRNQRRQAQNQAAAGRGRKNTGQGKGSKAKQQQLQQQQKKKKPTQKQQKQTQKKKTNKGQSKQQPKGKGGKAKQKPTQAKKKQQPPKKTKAKKPKAPKAKPLTREQLDDELDRMMGKDPAEERRKRERELLDEEMDMYRSAGKMAQAEADTEL